MADVQYRGNLKAATFPFVSELFGRTVIVRGQDQNTSSVVQNENSAMSANAVPQIYYCHNVVPTSSGYKSVAYQQYADSIFSEAVGFQSVHSVRDGAGNSALLSITALGNLYVMLDGTSNWISPSGAPAASSIAGKRITTAFVSGVTYIYFSNFGCYTYDFGTNTLSSVTLSGLTAADLIGVVGNSGYLIAYSSNAVAWSSTIDPTDFVPSLVTGAGGGGVEGLKGYIVHLQEIFGGFVIFASDNAVAGVYSGDALYPYIFTAIQGCGGVSDYRHVAADTGNGNIYAYTDSGVQSINTKSATLVFPELTDYLSGSYFEDFDEQTNNLIVTEASGAVVQKRLSFVSDRYMIISYGLGKLTHALYYDAGYNSWGRLKLDHVACFEINQYASSEIELPKRSIAFLTSGGGIRVLNTDIGAQGSNGVMLLGKFQYVRSRWIVMQEAAIENVNPNENFELLILPTLDGKNFEPPVTGYLSRSSGKLREYRFRSTALNFTLVWKGAFNAVSFMLTFCVAGAR